MKDKQYAIIEITNGLTANELLRFSRTKLEHTLLQGRTSIKEDSEFCTMCREILPDLNKVLDILEQDSRNYEQGRTQPYSTTDLPDIWKYRGDRRV